LYPNATTRASATIAGVTAIGCAPTAFPSSAPRSVVPKQDNFYDVDLAVDAENCPAETASGISAPASYAVPAFAALLPKSTRSAITAFTLIV